MDDAVEGEPTPLGFSSAKFLVDQTEVEKFTLAFRISVIVTTSCVAPRANATASFDRVSLGTSATAERTRENPSKANFPSMTALGTPAFHSINLGQMSVRASGVQFDLQCSLDEN
jgi:hypothetical protein